MRPPVLVLDVGGSGVRLLAVVGDGSSSIRLEGESPVRGAVVDLDRLAAIIAETVRRLDLDAPGDLQIGLSTAGYHKTGTDTAAFHEAVRISGAVTRTVVVSDVVAGFVGCLGIRSGAVISAGTGAVAIGRDEEGRWRLADGWGYMLGDEGSGFWVGRAGLDAALRYTDGRRGGSGQLAQLASDMFGKLESLPGRLATDMDRVATVAGFARSVVTAAETNDPIAAGIVDQAARALAVTLQAVLPEAGVVSYAGGLLTDTTSVLRRLQNDPELAAYKFQEPEGDALSGIRRLMDEPTVRLSEFLRRYGSVRHHT